MPPGQRTKWGGGEPSTRDHDSRTEGEQEGGGGRAAAREGGGAKQGPPPAPRGEKRTEHEKTRGEGGGPSPPPGPRRAFANERELPSRRT